MSRVSDAASAFAFRDAKGRVRDAASLGLPLNMTVADTHAHLATLRDPVRELARCAWWGVDFLNLIMDPVEECDLVKGTCAYDELDRWVQVAGGELRKIAESAGPGDLSGAGLPVSRLHLPEMRIMVGVHPHNAKDWSGDYASYVRSAVAGRRLPGGADAPEGGGPSGGTGDLEVVGIGEIGLDYHYDLSPREDQQAVFAEELSMACELDVPVSLHLREAHADALAIMREVGIPDAGCILHCCSLDSEGIAPFLELGCYIAYGGAITFASCDDARAAARLVPLDRLLTETDCPYMAPTPLRGTKCAPAHVAITAARLARECIDPYGGLQEPSGDGDLLAAAGVPAGEDAGTPADGTAPLGTLAGGPASEYVDKRTAFLAAVHANALRLLWGREDG